MKTFLLLIEFDKRNFSENELDNFILNLKKRNYNFIYFILSCQKVNLIYADRIYISDSKFCFLNVLKYIKLHYDYIIHLRYLKYVNFDKIITTDYKDNIIYASNDKNNNFCKIIPKNIISALDQTYYTNNEFEVINDILVHFRTNVDKCIKFS